MQDTLPVILKAIHRHITGFLKVHVPNIYSKTHNLLQNIF